MYAEALAERRIFCSEKMVLKLGLAILTIAVFSGRDLSMNAYDTAGVIKGYINENIVIKEEQNDNALFLLEENWLKSLNEKYADSKLKTIDKGVVYVGMTKYVNSRRIKMNVVEVNRNLNKNIEIIPVMSSKEMHSKAKISVIASRTNAIAAVNGTYFKQDTGTPLGTLVINNEIISGPIYERVAFGISDDGFKTARLSFEGQFRNGNKILKINNINQPRMMYSQIIIYTPKWGTTVPLPKKECRHVSVANNKIINISDSPVRIPKNGFVISAPKEYFQGYKTGDKVKFSSKFSSDWKNVNHIISGGPYLMKNGQIYIDTASQKLNGITGRNPRTAIGYTKDNIMIMVTIDGRKEGISGVTLKELAEIMKKLGCYEAINLDGGSSTVMYADGDVYNGTKIINSVKISNALVVRHKS